MSKRRKKRRRRAENKPAGPETASPTAAGVTTAAPRAPIVPWRDQVRALMDALRGFARTQHAEAVDGLLRHAFGDPPEPEHPADAERLVDDFICTAGSAGNGRSILRVFCEETSDLEAEAREQALRWERERGRGVFLVQRCFADRIDLWDPLEGAALGLALLDRMQAGRAAEIRPATVATLSYVPYQARLIAVGRIEMYGDPEALRLFREQVRESGQPWHDAPPPAPLPS